MLLLLLVFCGLIRASEATVVFQTSLDSSTDVVFEDAPPGAGLTARSGSATKTHSCNYIRGLPSNLRYSSEMYPHGLTQFYQKYTEAYGIPVVSSNRVPDDALKRACYVLRFMMADHSGIRNNFYRRYGRVGVMAVTEYTTNIPEHSWLEPVFWNARARGLGATEQWPISTGAEENILCYSRDSYSIEDIFLHEFAHGVHLLGAKYAISGWDRSLTYWYNDRRSRGLWANTYAMSTDKEYFAEGVQSFFNVNAYSQYANGVHNHVSTKDVLKTYDYELYKLVAQVFPCGNTFIKRCEKSRSKEAAQRLLMNCNEGDGEREGGGGDDTDPDPEPQPEPSDCEDLHKDCGSWQAAGYCKGQHEEYMSKNCKKSCDLCEEKGPKPEPDCQDIEANCVYWEGEGYCRGQWQEYMEENCKKSCNKCPSDEEEEEDEDEEEEELPPACYDRNAKCKKKTRKGHCTKKPEYMMKNCKKSCKMC